MSEQCQHDGLECLVCRACVPAEISMLRADVERLKEHLGIADTYTEKYRRNWVEACQEREALRSDVRALREYVAKFRAWVQHHDDCDEYPLDGYEREHGVPAGESVCNCGLNALLTGEPGPGGEA